jgi:hypothetical protein
LSGLPDNFNPLRHDCEARGCWNKQYRPQIEFFYHALPRKLTMSDIDAVAEVNGHFLFLEWKSHKGPLPVGQRILIQRLTDASRKIIVVVIQHEPGNTEAVENIMVVRAGKFGDWEACSYGDLFERVKQWATRADVRVVSRKAVT